MIPSSSPSAIDFFHNVSITKIKGTIAKKKVNMLFIIKKPASIEAGFLLLKAGIRFQARCF